MRIDEIGGMDDEEEVAETESAAVVVLCQIELPPRKAGRTRTGNRANSVRSNRCLRTGHPTKPVAPPESESAAVTCRSSLAR